MIDRILRRLGLVRTSLVVEAVHATDGEQRTFLRPGQCTAWAVMTYLDYATGDA